VAIAEIKMPRLSDSMEEGTILEWRKAVGELVEMGEEIAEIETDKATMVYEADVAGVLAEILAGDGETVAVGAVIARVGGSAEEISSGGRTAASPLARRIAEAAGVDLATVTGSGPEGRIVKLDVEAAHQRAGSPAPAPAPDLDATETAKGTVESVEPSRTQALVARRMSQSKASAPHIYLTRTIDMTPCVEARARLKAGARGGLVPSFNDMVVRACALALRAHPRVNGAYVDGRFELYGRINVGIAVATDDSLVVPTVFDADSKGLAEIATESRALAEDVRAGRITPPQLAGGTFTVSNLGMFGIGNFGAVINPPQAAILAVGEIAEAPVVRDGTITVAQVMEVTLACDHRILGGAEGATFLASVCEALTQPAAIAEV
jgi:pyruvate dehydrogenase E2 component (dihydrolipoamide acetyltransferase)